MNTRHQTVLALGLFILLTVLMTYPLVLHMGTHVRDHGDPLLNAWILSWNNRQMVRLDLEGWFEANIYHPYGNTLAYSEHLFPQSLAALPVKLLSGNPILAYNVVLLFGFLTSAWGMFCLARRLTGHFLGAVAAGFIFAFSPFMIAHLFHIQVVTAGGIPLTFLFLIRFFEDGKWKDLLLFSLFFILQALANGYYALYLSLMAGLFILVMTLVRRKWREPKFWVQMAVFAALAAVCIGPFLYHYAQVKSLLGLKRGIGGARLTSYLATSPLNVLYGRITEPFRIGEGELFPGVAVVLLAFAGGAAALRFRRGGHPGPAPEPRRGARLLQWTLAAVTAFNGFILYQVVLKGGFELSLFAGLKIHSRSILKPFLALSALLIAYHLLKKIFRTGPLLRARTIDPLAWTFFLILVLAFFMTFGRGGPYQVFAAYIPGFEGLRAAARSHVFVMMSLALFAAFGLRLASLRLKGAARAVMLALVPLILLAEYFSVPVQYSSIPVKKGIPAVYQWLASQKGEFALLEFPLAQEGRNIGAVECPRIYYSSYHWKRLVNGFSGYIPPLYEILQERWSGAAPLEQNLNDLKALGVRYLVLHESLMPPEAVPVFKKDFAALPDLAVFAGKFGEALVYEMKGWREKVGDLAPSTENLRKIERRPWNVSADINREAAPNAVDGIMETRWDTAGAQQSGQSFQVDLGRTQRLALLRLFFAPSPRDYPRGFRVEASSDGRTWTTVALRERVFVDIRKYLHPRELSLDIPLPDVTARFLRVVNTGEEVIYYWSIHELEIYENASPAFP